MTEREKILSELTSGLTSALVTLVDTLDQEGVLAKSKYRDNLLILWNQMPEENAQSGEGMIFERLIDYLN